ncbi:MAG: hypothetical protein MI922_23550, partial [Bacteroidales bacterium]|nr:hypothetical protein [Bacteroidales bacterium]
HDVMPHAGLHGRIVPDETVSVAHGGEYEFTAIPDAGYQVEVWYVDESLEQLGGNTFTATNIMGDVTVSVLFREKEGCRLTPEAGNYGRISPDEELVVECGSSYTFQGKPSPGYMVNWWYVDSERAQGGGERFTLEDIQDDHTITVTFKRQRSISLGMLDFDSLANFYDRIIDNNSIDPNDPNQMRVFVEHIVGESPDPNGYLILHSLMDEDPGSLHYGKMLPARVKARFPGTPRNPIVIRFKYLFTSDAPGVELNVYFSGVPELMNPYDPTKSEHDRHVARLLPPPPGHPGAPDSGRFAIFEKEIFTGSLDLTKGLWVELELIEPVPSRSVAIDDWNAYVQCYGICMDLNWDNFVDTADFLQVIGECGKPAVGEQACSEGVYSEDGMVDSEDIAAWDWALNEDGDFGLCSIPFVGHAVSAVMQTHMVAKSHSAKAIQTFTENAADATQIDGLWVLGKRRTQQAATKLEDRLYTFDREGALLTWSTPTSKRGNTRLIKDQEGDLYLLNTNDGLVTMTDPQTTVIPSAAFSITSQQEPRYHHTATVTIGLQKGGGMFMGVRYWMLPSPVMRPMSFPWW